MILDAVGETLIPSQVVIMTISIGQYCVHVYICILSKEFPWFNLQLPMNDDDEYTALANLDLIHWHCKLQQPPRQTLHGSHVPQECFVCV